MGWFVWILENKAQTAWYRKLVGKAAVGKGSSGEERDALGSENFHT